MSIGCHQVPCRCELPCICDWSKDDAIDRNCERHDSRLDSRFLQPDDDDYDGYGDGERLNSFCPECGAEGHCAVDDIGRPLIHTLTDPEDDQ